MSTFETQYMSLVLPTPTSEPGPDYAYEINSAMVLVDQHDHSPTRGTPVTPSGLNINSELAFNNNNAITLKSARFQNQTSPLATASDIGCVYVSGVDLYYNDRNSNQIRITQSGGVAGTPGSITGLLPPASVVYTPGNATFTFQSSTATAGNIDAGSYTLREVIPNANGITLASPASLASNYTITLLPSLPTSAIRFLRLDTSGNISFSPIPSSTATRFVTVDTSGVMGFSSAVTNNKISAIYNTTAAQAIPNSSAVVVNFGTKIFDSNNAVTTGGTWRFIAPRTDMYACTVKTTLTGIPGGVFGYAVAIRVNGTDIHNADYEIAGGGSNTFQTAGGVFCSANDFIDFTFGQATGGPLNLTATASQNIISITA